MAEMAPFDTVTFLLIHLAVQVLDKDTHTGMESNGPHTHLENRKSKKYAFTDGTTVITPLDNNGDTRSGSDEIGTRSPNKNKQIPIRPYKDNINSNNNLTCIPALHGDSLTSAGIPWGPNTSNKKESITIFVNTNTVGKGGSSYHLTYSTSTDKDQISRTGIHLVGANHYSFPHRLALHTMLNEHVGTTGKG